MKKQQINVSVFGKYWKYLDYESYGDVDFDDSNKMIVYAETIASNDDIAEYPTMRSASVEFECIDRIYEANVRMGKIKDTIGNFTKVLEEIKGKKVVILGTGAKEQDTYDLLYQHGIDIYSFAEWKPLHKTLLGKKIINISEVLCREDELIFINSHDRSSALGSEEAEIFDYYGYARNEQYFLIQDYTNIPCSNLTHVLKGKIVWLTGEEKLCLILADYLSDVEQDDIDVQYVELEQCMLMKESTILCTVYPFCGEANNPKFWYVSGRLSSMADLSYTGYFSCVNALSIIDIYRNRNHEKYSVKQLIPKGILLGRIPYASGNVFLRGILDGHPNILKCGYNIFNDNLFFYCMCLANEKSQDIINVLEEMLQIEYILQSGEDIVLWDKFKKRTETFLSLKEYFSSQELFVIFHIVYAEIISGMKVSDLGDKVIYWEPHSISRTEFPYLAQWLEDEKINGQTIYMHRDNIVRTGSRYKSYEANPFSLEVIHNMVGSNMVEEDEYSGQHWTEFHVRFEDIKLHPKVELTKICDRFEIPWSDTMLRTTSDGRAWSYQGVMDFDIMPVFNKYEEYLSAFDRFRIALISSPYQKLYGYTYENCMKFSRKVLQDMFLKKFRFQENLKFESREEEIVYYLHANRLIRWGLWKARRHEVLDDVIPQLEQMDIGQSMSKEESEKRCVSKWKLEKMVSPKGISQLAEFVRRQEKLVLYGIGRDCEALLEYLGDCKPRVVFCDIVAAYQKVFFHGSRVITPNELCRHYDDYQILITSSRCYQSIYGQLEKMGIAPERIVCNAFQLWQEER